MSDVDLTDDGAGGNTPDDGLNESTLTMGVDPYERNWMRLTIGLLVVFFATISVAGLFMGFQVTGAYTEVDPRIVLDSEPWSEPGLRKLANGDYEVYVVAQTWSFSPREIEVPVGSKVTIYVTSPDLQHGFKITDTNINTMVVPGQVSKMSYTFDTVGEFPYICHEYCGSGHAAMYGTVKVVPNDSGSAAPDLDEDTSSDEEAAK